METLLLKPTKIQYQMASKRLIVISKEQYLLTMESKQKKLKKGETIPDGWSVGASNNNRCGYKLSDEQKYKIKKSHQNRIRVTNGRNNKYIKNR